MSGDHLPDDLRQWPRDPYQVLGVASPCDPREARKAYTRLIRRFKPEQYPDHFQRIREAYDAIQRDALFHSTFPPAETTDTAGDVAEPWAPDLAIPSVTPDLLPILWDKACNGQEAEAYRRLAALGFTRQLIPGEEL